MILSPIQEESHSTALPIAAEFDYLMDMVIRHATQMEEVMNWMKKLEDDWSTDREEFKSLLLDLQGLCFSCDEKYTPSHRCKKLEFASVGDCTRRREGKILGF